METKVTMNHRRKNQPLSISRNGAYGRAIEEINLALEQNTEHPNDEKIRLARLALFGDIDAMEISDTITLPKRK
jgi:hypothetical protein